MTKTSLLLAALASGLIAGAPAQAQPPYPGADDMHARPDSRGAMMPPRMPRMAPPSRMPPAHQFPSPDELARMVPPEPLTEEQIRERFASQRAQLKEMIERDREAATRYAQDFAKYQKQQSDMLARMMSRAEKKREAMLKALDSSEQMVLERFRQYQQAEESNPQEPGKESSAQ